MVRRSAQRRAVRRAVHVRDVGADRKMHGHRHARAVGRDQHARLGIFHPQAPAGQQLPRRFAHPDSAAVSAHGDFIQIEPSFLGHAECAAAQRGLDVFGGVAGQCDLEIVHQPGAVCRDAADEVVADHVNQHWREPDLEDVPAQAPENGLAARSRAEDGPHHRPQIVRGQNPRQ